MTHQNISFSADSGVETHTPNLGPLPEWRLSDLYESMDAPALTADLNRAQTTADAFAERYQGKLADLARGPKAGAELAAAVKIYEDLQETLGRIISYAGLLYAGESTDPARTKFYGDMQEKITNISSALIFFQLEVNRLDDALLDSAMAEEPLSHWRPWLEDIRKEKPHELDEKLEQLFHEKSITASSAWNRLFDETIAALRFSVDGRELGMESTLTLMQDPSEEKRRAAAHALGETLSANERVFTLITNTLAKDKEISDRWRSFADVADSRHLANRVEPEVVDALAAAVQEAYPRLSHRYYKLKAKWFGCETLDFWNRNAPLPQTPQKTYTWDQARETVLSAYAGFSPRMAAIAQQFFDNNWIDAPVRPGKSPGAFAHPTTPSAHPYILLNYQGKPRDVMTLAHELGHGVHQVLAAPQGALMAPTPLTLAETASVFGEMLTFRALIDQTQDIAMRRALIAAKVEDMINTVVRQIAFYHFERALHLERRKGELTTGQINALWMRTQNESLGPSVRLTPDYASYWSYIPHFIHSPFYVYAYAFGDCLVNSLYGVYARQPEGFVDHYFALLEAGGSKRYADLLTPFGLNPRDPKFWQIGLRMIGDFIEELEAMEV